MRNHLVTFLSLTLISVFFTACESRPEKTVVSAQIDPAPRVDGVPTPSPKPTSPVNTPVALARNGLWFATSNGVSGGTLGRVDLVSGKIETNVLPLGADVVLKRDGNDGIFLLNRRGTDSVVALAGASAQIGATAKLVSNVNPQDAIRDARGRLWVVSLDSNVVRIFSPDLSTEVGSVDLTVLREANSTDGFAELAEIANLDESRVIVTAQRLRRTSAAWAPERAAGVAVLNVDTFQIEETYFPDATNPAVLSVRDHVATIIGSGDLSDPRGYGAAKARLDFTVNASGVASPGVPTLESLPHRVIDADFGEGESVPSLSVIDWDMAANRMCVTVDTRPVLCLNGDALNGSYFFNRVLRKGNDLYLSYVAIGHAELWVVSIDTGVVRTRAQLNLPVESMTFGP